MKAGGDGDHRGWDGCVASPTQWTWVWVNSGRWWRTGRPGVLQSMVSQRAKQDWSTEPQQQLMELNDEIWKRFTYETIDYDRVATECKSFP